MKRHHRVLVAVGQPAIEVVSGMRAHIVYALVPDPPAGAIGTNSIAAPSAVPGAPGGGSDKDGDKDGGKKAGQDEDEVE